MPYKRRLRLLWIAVDHPQWAREAWEFAAPLSVYHIEHRGAASAHVSEWPDLIVTLDDAARDTLPPLPARVQVRHLDLAGTADPAARRALIEVRVSGILGGLRLLDRMSDDPDPP